MEQQSVNSDSYNSCDVSGDYRVVRRTEYSIQMNVSYKMPIHPLYILSYQRSVVSRSSKKAGNRVGFIRTSFGYFITSDKRISLLR